jgi:hypothetical protein
MQRNLRNALLVCGTILGLLALVYPFLSSMAQKSQNQKDQEQEKALEVVRQNVVANIFYDTLQSQETGWILTKAGNISGPPIDERVRGHFAGSVNLVLRKDKSEAQVIIDEYSSEEDAKFPLTMSISQGIIKDCKGDECGDEGQKIYRSNSDFAYLKFRKGRFFVSIRCNSEEVARRFAGYVINAIANR